jgi:hypothetical protein
MPASHSSESHPGRQSECGKEIIPVVMAVAGGAIAFLEQQTPPRHVHRLAVEEAVPADVVEDQTMTHRTTSPAGSSSWLAVGQAVYADSCVASWLVLSPW